MANMTIRASFKIDGVLTNASAAALSNGSAAYGVKRRDTGEVVVDAGTAVTHDGTGLYSYEIEDVIPYVEYVYSFHFVYGGENYHVPWSKRAPNTGNLYDVLPLILSHAGADDAIVKQVLRRTARDFCVKTGIWQEDLDAIPTEEGEDEYELATDYDATILRVNQVTVDGLRVNYRVNNEATLLTLCAEAGVDDLDIVPSVVFEPNVSCTVYPSWFITKYGDGLADGALADLLSMPGKPWSNPGEANKRLLGYREAMVKAKRQILTANGPGVIQPRRRRFV
ncbi:MAG: hypothetical protein AMXMBFR84_25930 [Candidatus Hydrogenedentota bacterium]